MGRGPTIPTEAHFDKGSWGHDGTEWRKFSLLWGYSDRWAETVSELNAVVGTNNLYTAAVPAGYVYVLQGADCINVNSACTREIGPAAPGSLLILVQDAGALAGTVTMTGPCEVVLKEGDVVKSSFVGCTAGDDLYLRVWGYKMRVT